MVEVVLKTLQTNTQRITVPNERTTLAELKVSEARLPYKQPYKPLPITAKHWQALPSTAGGDPPVQSTAKRCQALPDRSRLATT